MCKLEKTPPEWAGLDAELRRQLEIIRSEETPERLLELAKALQDLLRARARPN